MKPQVRSSFDPKMFLTKVSKGKTVIEYRKKQIIFAQGDRAEAVLYILKGRVKLTVVSSSGKEAVVAILGGGEFFGEGCLAGQLVRMTMATAVTCAPLCVSRKAR